MDSFMKLPLIQRLLVVGILVAGIGISAYLRYLNQSGKHCQKLGTIAH